MGSLDDGRVPALRLAFPVHGVGMKGRSPAGITYRKLQVPCPSRRSESNRPMARLHRPIV